MLTIRQILQLFSRKQYVANGVTLYNMRITIFPSHSLLTNSNIFKFNSLVRKVNPTIASYSGQIG